jgi:hypothetical protein
MFPKEKTAVSARCHSQLRRRPDANHEAIGVSKKMIEDGAR